MKSQPSNLLVTDPGLEDQGVIARVLAADFADIAEVLEHRHHRFQDLPQRLPPVIRREDNRAAKDHVLAKQGDGGVEIPGFDGAAEGMARAGSAVGFDPERGGDLVARLVGEVAVRRPLIVNFPPVPVTSASPILPCQTVPVKPPKSLEVDRPDLDLVAGVQGYVNPFASSWVLICHSPSGLETRHRGAGCRCSGRRWSPSRSCRRAPQAATSSRRRRRRTQPRLPQRVGCPCRQTLLVFGSGSRAFHRAARRRSPRRRAGTPRCDSSAAVRSRAVPNVVTVLRNVSSCRREVYSSNGTATPPRSRVSSKPPG